MESATPHSPFKSQKMATPLKTTDDHLRQHNREAKNIAVSQHKFIG